MPDWISDTQAVALIGAIGGILLGLAARLGRFCTLGAIEDRLYGGSDIRLRMWGLAIGTAIFGSFALMAGGLLSADSTTYLASRWQPAASVMGGLMFGYGMALAGNCGFGAIARLGGGDLRSFVIVLVMGVSTFVVLSGPLAAIRIAILPQAPHDGDVLPGIAHFLSSMTGVAPHVVGMAIGIALFGWMLTSAELRAKPVSIFWGAMVGLAVVSGWAGTQWVANTGFEGTPVSSHTFSAPVGETILYAMTGSARALSFGVGSVVGVWIGAFAGSLIKGHFRWEACEDPRELRRQIIGAGIMGIGAVIALGCTIGQGVSAFSVLAWSAPVTFAAIFAGAAIGLRQLIEGFQPAE